MATNNPPKQRTEIDPEKITNQSERVVNNQIPHEHEPTNEEQWVHDVNEEFGDDFVLPDDESKET